MRASTPKQRASLKTAVRINIEKCGGGRAVADLTRVNEAMLSLYAAPYDDTRWSGIDVALDLDIAAGEPGITRAMASAQGYDLVRSTPVVAGGDELGLDDFARLIRETRDFEINLLSALADRKITPLEKEILFRDICEVEAVISDLRRKVVEA